MAWLLEALLGVALAGTPGTVLPSAPPVPPGTMAPRAADPLRAAIDARTQGDLAAALRHYGAALQDKRLAPGTRASVYLALGHVHAARGDLNLASAEYGRARASGAPVAPWGAWYEASADHARGRHPAAASRCRSYRASWPDGPHADACLVLIGDASVAAGERGAAVGAYQAYLEKHPDSPMEEPLRLGIALAVAATDPARAVPMLRALVVDHAYHVTGMQAEQRLEELAAHGLDARLPDTPEWAGRVAAERRRCGYADEAWNRFQSLSERAAGDERLAAWVESQEERFAWGTSQYETLAARYADEYAASPSAGLAWDRYKALARAGLWKEASEQLQAGIGKHRGAGAFRGVQDDLARALLLAGRYAEARDAWTALSRSGGTAGDEARWLAAYAAFRVPDLPDAMARFEAVIKRGGAEALAARYYRARALQMLGRAEEAEAERRRILAEEPWSWYAVLLRSEGATASDRWTARVGLWPAPRPAPLPPRAPPGSGGVSTAAPVVARASTPAGVSWSALAWGVSPAPVDPPPPAAALPVTSWERRPDSYQPGFLYDPAEGDRVLTRWAAEHADLFPGLAAAADLARAGNFDDAAPLVARMFDRMQAVRDGLADPADPLTPKLAALELSLPDARAMAYFARDHNHAAKLSWGTTRLAATDAERRVALQRAFPTAEIDAIYRHGQAFDLDPFLVLGLMRQESVYRQWALSPVGAIGLMQVMPRTGGRIAALLHEPRFSPADLEDPVVNVRYGTWYLSRLMSRFEGAWPLAVASYNGGPHNVGSWLRPWGAGIRMDDFVEQIPYPETRDYVKKVTGYYETYVELYGPEGARVLVPATPRGDHPDIVNF